MHIVRECVCVCVCVKWREGLAYVCVCMDKCMLAVSSYDPVYVCIKRMCMSVCMHVYVCPCIHTFLPVCVCVSVPYLTRRLHVSIILSILPSLRRLSANILQVAVARTFPAENAAVWVTSRGLLVRVLVVDMTCIEQCVCVCRVVHEILPMYA